MSVHNSIGSISIDGGDIILEVFKDFGKFLGRHDEAT